MSTVSSMEGGKRKPTGAVLFTGPDGVGNHRTTVADPSYVGHGFMSPESSSDTQYLYRSAPVRDADAKKNKKLARTNNEALTSCPHPPPKTARVGEVGWGVPRLTHPNDELLLSGHQIQLKEFRQALEDRHTHLYQNPYYPPPSSGVATTTADAHQQSTTSSDTTIECAVFKYHHSR